VRRWWCDEGLVDGEVAKSRGVVSIFGVVNGLG